MGNELADALSHASCNERHGAQLRNGNVEKSSTRWLTGEDP